MNNEFIEFDTNEGLIIIKLSNITLIKKNKPEYPKFETTYSVHVNRWYWTLDGQEGEVVYSQYKEWLTRATQA